MRERERAREEERERAGEQERERRKREYCHTNASHKYIPSTKAVMNSPMLADPARNLRIMKNIGPRFCDTM